MEAADFSLGPMEAARRRAALRIAGIAPEGFEGRAMSCELCGRLLAALGHEKLCEGAAFGADEHIGWACPECGCDELEDDFRYCSRCGVPVDFYGDRR